MSEFTRRGLRGRRCLIRQCRPYPRCEQVVPFGIAVDEQVLFDRRGFEKLSRAELLAGQVDRQPGRQPVPRMAVHAAALEHDTGDEKVAAATISPSSLQPMWRCPSSTMLMRSTLAKATAVSNAGGCGTRRAKTGRSG
jgi:hypothetical protein